MSDTFAHYSEGIKQRLLYAQAAVELLEKEYYKCWDLLKVEEDGSGMTVERLHDNMSIAARSLEKVRRGLEFFWYRVTNNTEKIDND